MRTSERAANLRGMQAQSDPAHVLVAGGGFGGVEAMLALRALAGERVRVTLVSPSSTFAYRPAATTEPFYEARKLTYDLKAIAADVGASFRRDRLEAVAATAHSARLASFARIRYDALVLAVGARAASAIPGALTFRDQHEAHHIRRLMDDLARGGVRRIVFAVPSGCSWPLPLYELALLTATRIQELGAASEVVLVTSEAAPLQVFGAEATPLVASLLAERGVSFLGESNPRRVDRGGSLVLASGETLAADRVVAAPVLVGPRIGGLPTDPRGFVATDALGGVVGLPDVYAVGDITSFPIKQGGLAAQQADTVAQRLALDLGVAVTRSRARRILRARLVGGAAPVFLQTELDALGQPTAASTIHGQLESFDADAPPEKVFGRYLSPYLRTRERVPAPPVQAAGGLRGP